MNGEMHYDLWEPAPGQSRAWAFYERVGAPAERLQSRPGERWFRSAKAVRVGESREPRTCVERAEAEIWQFPDGSVLVAEQTRVREILP